MNPPDYAQLAADHVRERLAEHGPPEARVIHCESAEEWSPELLRTISEHRLHVLGRGPDIVVYFHESGALTGWRDDGRKGTEKPAWIDRDAFREAIVSELELPEETRLGKLAPAELPPLGWTHEAVLMLTPVPRPQEILRVWASPETLKVIQCLYGPVAEGQS